MRFFETLLSGAALVAAALALEINTYPSGGVRAGQTYTVTYSPADNTPTTFILRQGPSGNLNTISTLTTTATGGTFSWTVASSLPNQADYALEIQQGSVINYSGQFALSGGSAAVSSASAALSSARASASSVVASAASSASAALSSALASVSSAQASATVSASAGANSTVSSATLSRSSTSSARASATSSGSVPQSTGAASVLSGSPLAAIFGAVAAFAYLA